MRCCVKIRAAAKMYILPMAHARTNGTHVRMIRAGVASGRKRGDVGRGSNVGKNKMASYAGSERPIMLRKLRESDNRLVRIKV
jgi:hypothetical protein